MSLFPSEEDVLGKAKTASNTMTEARKLTTLERSRDKNEGAAVLDEMTFEQLLAELAGEGELLDVAEIGEGYPLLRGPAGKDLLVNVPFVVIKYRINENWTYGEGV